MGKRRSVAAEAAKKCELKEICIYDNADVLNRRENDWVDGWETRYKRLWTVQLITDQLFNNILTTYTSKDYFCEPYSRASIIINSVVAGAPTDIVIQVQLSDDSVNWYQRMDGPFGDLRYVAAGGNIKESIDFDIRATWIRLRAIAAGTTAVNTFLLNAKVNLVS